MIDDVTGLPLLSSDIYQIPLNTDAIPYNDLQAETRLPRQPMLPDDIIPTIALTTGLRSDGTGEVVHTDDHHAQWVYVVNQPAPSAGSSGGGIEATHFDGVSDYFMTANNSDVSTLHGPIIGSGKITDVRVEGALDNIVGGYSRDIGRIILNINLIDNGTGLISIGMLLFYYDNVTAQFSKMHDIFQVKYPNGLDPAALGLAAGDQVVLNTSLTGSFPVRLSASMGYTVVS